MGMANVLNEEKKQQVLALGRLGWSLRRIHAFDNLIWPHFDTHNWPHLINKDAGPVRQRLTVPAGMECRGRGGVSDCYETLGGPQKQCEDALT